MTAQADIPFDRLAARAEQRGGRPARFFFSRPKLRGYAMVSPAVLLMTIGILGPVLVMIVMSFWTADGFGFNRSMTSANFARIVHEPIFMTFLLRSFWIAGIATLITVVLCYPMAYYVAFHVKQRKMLWIILMSLPFWSSYLIRVFAWKVILGFEGAINTGLMAVGLIDQPMEFLLYSQTAVVITLCHAWAAFALLPLYIALESIDRSYLEAAADLGDGPVKRFLRITLPLSMPGVIAAALMIFIPTTGDYITAYLVGGPDSPMIGQLIYLQFGVINNWPMGAALSVTLMLWVGAIIFAFTKLTRARLVDTLV